jgi:hypothetical protein
MNFASIAASLMLFALSSLSSSELSVARAGVRGGGGVAWLPPALLIMENVEERYEAVLRWRLWWLGLCGSIRLAFSDTFLACYVIHR